MLVGDSAYPLKTYPTSWNGKSIEGWGFYIGGNTPHVWSAEEVEELKKHYRYLLPIYTRSNPQSANPLADAVAAINKLRLLKVPTGVEIQLDYETSIDSAFEKTFSSSLMSAGYLTLLYGSRSTVVKNAVPSGGYNEAEWTGKDYAPSSTADQFGNFGSYDLNDFRDDAKLWDTRPVPPKISPVSSRPQIQRGSTGYWVETCQRSLMLAGCDPKGVNEDFGNYTYAAAVAFQRAVHIQDNGQVGPDTWGHLEARTLVVQKALAAHGHGEGGEDSVAGPKTDSALRAFQRAHGLLPDGICGQHTSTALGVPTVVR